VRDAGTDVSSGALSRPASNAVVATVGQSDPGNALRQYLHGWMTDYNAKAGAGDSSSAVASWTPEIPDDIVSIMPSVSLSDFGTVAAWSATIAPLGPVTTSTATYRADFTFWRGSPLSSVRPATALSSFATYDLVWNTTRRVWVITQTSASPDQNLEEHSD
jgi:hypothetical protein